MEGTRYSRYEWYPSAKILQIKYLIDSAIPKDPKDHKPMTAGLPPRADPLAAAPPASKFVATPSMPPAAVRGASVAPPTFEIVDEPLCEGGKIRQWRLAPHHLNGATEKHLTTVAPYHSGARIASNCAILNGTAPRGERAV